MVIFSVYQWLFRTFYYFTDVLEWKHVLLSGLVAIGVAAVLFAFFTNKKWVFTEADKSVRTSVQLVKFAGGRVITFFIDYGVTLFAAMGAAALFPSLASVSFIGKEWNLCEIGAKVIAAVIVIVCNYIFSKIFVFKNKKQ